MTTNCKYSYEDNINPYIVITLDEKPIKNVKIFRYISSQIVHNENTTEDWEVNSQIESAKNKFSSMRNLLLNHIRLFLFLPLLQTQLRAFPLNQGFFLPLLLLKLHLILPAWK